MPDMILTLRTGQRTLDKTFQGLGFRGYLLKIRESNGIEPAGLPADDAVSGEIDAHINHGRWIVECGVCHTAVLMDDQDLVFYCPGCGTDGQWRRVIMPDPTERAEIERLLLLRQGWHDKAPTRNWTPGNTLADLQRENLQHGREV